MEHDERLEFSRRILRWKKAWYFFTGAWTWSLIAFFIAHATGEWYLSRVFLTAELGALVLMTWCKNNQQALKEERDRMEAKGEVK